MAARRGARRASASGRGTHDVDPWFVPGGMLRSARRPPRTTSGRGPSTLRGALGDADRWRAAVARRGRRPAPLAGVPRRRVHAARRDRPAGARSPAGCGASPSSAASTIHERTRVERLERRRRGVTSDLADGAGTILRRPGRRRAQRLGRRLAGRFGRRLDHVVQLHRPDRADPRPPRRDRLDRRRGDRRLAVHAPLRPADAGRPDRARRRRRSGRATAAGSAGRSSSDARLGATRRRGPPALVPEARRRPDRRRLGRPDRHRRLPPAVVRDAAGRRGSTSASGTAATASRRRRSAGGSSRRFATGRATTSGRACRCGRSARRRGRSRRSRSATSARG